MRTIEPLGLIPIACQVRQVYQDYFEQCGNKLHEIVTINTFIAQALELSFTATSLSIIELNGKKCRGSKVSDYNMTLSVVVLKKTMPNWNLW